MDAGNLREICIESCKETYDYLEAMQNMGEEVSQYSVAVTATNMGSYFILTAEQRIPDVSMLKLCINGKVYPENEVEFEQFDEISRTVTMYPSDNVRNVLSSGKRNVTLISDMKFLIERTKLYFNDFGDLVNYPKNVPKFTDDEFSFPSGATPSEEQNKAVRTMLNSKLSYVWGAPGTGKTQMVLATAMLAYLKKGKRVCVVAPTNNSLEQVLRGLIEIIKKEDPNGKIVNLKKDILRVGVASSDFIKNYPDVCEKRGINAEIKSKEDAIDVLKSVRFEKNCEKLKPLFDEIDTLYGEEFDNAGFLAKRKMTSQIREYFKEIRVIVSSNEKFKHILDDVDEFNYKTRSQEIAKWLYNRPRPNVNIEEYDKYTDKDLLDKIGELIKKKAELEALDPIVRMSTTKIVAITPQTFMARFSPKERTGIKVPFDFDHIFIDEVGYCNVIQILPLFATGTPISMLGDHMQLPPVCEIDSEKIIKPGIENNNSMRYSFMWDQSALFAEEYLYKDIDAISGEYILEEPSEFVVTESCNLTISHRFGDNLAKTLDTCIYKNGITGVAKEPLETICIDAPCKSRSDRENMAEAKALRKFIEENEMDPKDFIVLTPYSKQVTLLKRTMPTLKENILTVHKSQGREWNTVILCVADSDSNTGSEVPLRFTSTRPSSKGVQVMNTAVSRAKKRLIIVCDRKFWAKQEGEMIGMMVKDLDGSKIIRYGDM